MIGWILGAVMCVAMFRLMLKSCRASAEAPDEHEDPVPDPIGDYERDLSEQIERAAAAADHEAAIRRGDLLGAAEARARLEPPLSDRPGEGIYYTPRRGR